jgi:hypothetical protein
LKLSPLGSRRLGAAAAAAAARQEPPALKWLARELQNEKVIAIARDIHKSDASDALLLSLPGSDSAVTISCRLPKLVDK